MRHALPLWLAVVMLLSFVPLKFKLMLGTTGPWHSWGHFLIFLTTMLLAAWSCHSVAARLVRAVIVLLFGISLEVGEVLLYHNSFEWHDVQTDALGVLSSLVLAHFFFAKRLKIVLSTAKSASTARLS